MATDEEVEEEGGGGGGVTGVGVGDSSLVRCDLAAVMRRLGGSAVELLRGRRPGRCRHPQTRRQTGRQIDRHPLWRREAQLR